MKALMIIAHEMFRDEEYFDPKKVLEENGVEVITASSELGTATGKLGAQTIVDTTINDIDTNAYNAIIFVGGAGCKEYWNNVTAHNIAREAVVLNKVLAGICSGAVILAKAGVLKNKQATCFHVDAQELIKEGAKYTNKPVAQDGLIITADGPKSALEFGATIVKTLEQIG